LDVIGIGIGIVTIAIAIIISVKVECGTLDVIPNVEAIEGIGIIRRIIITVTVITVIRIIISAIAISLGLKVL